MHKTLLATVSIAAIGISTAMAADLGAMPTKAPNFVAPTWTGAYVGLNAGYGWGNSDGTAVASDRFTPADVHIPSLEPKGFVGGGQVGYNWQTGPWVLGAELDFSGMNVKADQRVNPFFFGKGSGTYSTQYDWLLTARARAGITFSQNWLLYVTGGLAVTQVKDSITGGNVFGGDTTTWSSSKTLVGGTVGGGLEYAFAPNWSLKAEYLYAKFDDTAPSMSYSSPAPTPGFGAPRTGFGTIANFTHDLNIVRAGINYKFGG
jgi:outer membrane immunogenic protein